MTQPPEYDAPRTETQRLADDIQHACRTIRRDWDHMLRPGDTQAPGMASRNGVTLDDHDRSDADQRRIDRTMNVRRFAQDVVNGWSRVIIEDRPITNGATLPSGIDVSGMCEFVDRHADWLSGHEAAPDCRDELTDLMHRCHAIAFPTRRESMSIGRCPLEQPFGEEDVLEVCAGDVRYRLQYDERDGEAMAACSRCGEAAVVSWWEDKMFDDPETRKWLTDGDVVILVHRLYGEAIQQATVRQWVKRGVLEPSGETTQSGSRLFARDAVVYALDRHKRRAEINV